MKKMILLPAMILFIWHFSFGQNCAPGDFIEFLDVNSVKAGFKANGNLWFDGSAQALYEVPKDSGVTALLAGNFLIMGYNPHGLLKMSGQSYEHLEGFWPGPLDNSGNITSQTCSDFNYIWKINRSEIEAQKANFQQYGQSIPLAEIPTRVLEWPGRGNPHARSHVSLSLPSRKDLAPFVDVSGNGIYDPEKGDYPDVPGHQALWWIFNDKGNEPEIKDSDPVGIEIQVIAYAYEGIDSDLDHTTFYRTTFKNFGQDLDSAVVALFADPDLGRYDTDFLGSNPERDLAITYSARSTDDQYGPNPPLLGIKYLKGMEADGYEYRLSYFRHRLKGWGITAMPSTASSYFLYTTGRWLDGSYQNYGGLGVGNPADTIYPWMSDGIPGNDDWNECDMGFSPGDRIFYSSSGTFSWKAKEPKTLDFAVIWKRCGPQVDCYANFPCLFEAADNVQDFFDNEVKFNTGISDFSSGFEVSIYPNPAIEKISIRLPDDHPVYQVSIFSVDGKVWIDRKLSPGKQEISLEGISVGFYMVKVLAPDGTTIHRKLMIKNK